MDETDESLESVVAQSLLEEKMINVNDYIRRFYPFGEESTPEIVKNIIITGVSERIKEIEDEGEK